MTRTLPTTDALTDLWSLLEPDERPVCGVEHEYEVRDAAGAVLDFRELADTLELGRRLDPGDPHAHRGPWGGVVTADGREAEIVTPPVPVGAETPAVVHAYASAGRRHLAEHLPDGATLTGYSTHISTAVPDAVVRAVAKLVVRRLSPALMLLLDRRTSPGMLVRPRPGRLEVCGEFAQGQTLRHAVAVVVAAAQLCEEAAGDRGRGLPPELRVKSERAKGRFGTYIDRAAFGPDLYAAGRTAVLRRRGGTVTAGEHLAEVVALLEDRLRGLLSGDDLAALHAVVAGDLPLPCELETLEPDDEPRVDLEPLDLRPRRAGEIGVEFVHATWWTSVVKLDGPRVRWLTVPRTWLGSFLARLDDGSLDDVLTRIVRPAGP